jgi:hypothetical protein
MVTHRIGSSAIQAYRQLLERDSHPPVICAVGARVRFVFLLFGARLVPSGRFWDFARTKPIVRVMAARRPVPVSVYLTSTRISGVGLRQVLDFTRKNRHQISVNGIRTIGILWIEVQVIDNKVDHAGVARARYTFVASSVALVVL